MDYGARSKLDIWDTTACILSEFWEFPNFEEPGRMMVQKSKIRQARGGDKRRIYVNKRFHPLL
jgi:hypothetical protein